MRIPEPDYTLKTLLKDSELDYLGEYLIGKVNNSFDEKEPVIKSFRNFNDIAIPLIDFPCLKIYRTRETIFSSYSSLIISELTLNYISSFTGNKNVIADLHENVAKEITRVLINASVDPSFNLQLDFSNGYPTTSFDTFINPSNTVYKYATVNVSIYSDFRSLQNI